MLFSPHDVEFDTTHSKPMHVSAGSDLMFARMQVKDQTWTAGNYALKLNAEQGVPVRLFRRKRK